MSVIGCVRLTAASSVFIDRSAGCATTRGAIPSDWRIVLLRALPVCERCAGLAPVTLDAKRQRFGLRNRSPSNAASVGLTSEHTFSSLDDVKPLTARQAQVLRLIAEHLRRSGYPPTVRELCARLGLASPNAVSCHLRALERKGRIRRSPQSPRAIEIVGAATGIPMLGRIAAGEPILAVEETDHRLDVQSEFFGGGDLFALRVKGDSMVGDHIIDGDVVVVRRQDHASQGEIAAVLLDDEVTLKHVYRSEGEVELRSSNPSLPPITVEPGQAEPRLLGKVVGVIRKR